MPRETVTIPTPDGACPACVFTPDAPGPWRAVIFYMDALGVRPAMWEMAQRLADTGYLVLLPDLFYRDGPSEPQTPAEVLKNPAALEVLMKRVGSLDRAKKVTDTAAFLAYLAARPDVKGDTYGATGYCMGGNCVLTAAGAFPKKFAAAASFHGGGLATDSPESPHLFVAGITGRVYVAGAVEDAHFDDAQKSRLEAALTQAGVAHTVETYEGALHGFAVPDIPVYNEAAASRHWSALATLFGETLT